MFANSRSRCSGFSVRHFAVRKKKVRLLIRQRVSTRSGGFGSAFTDFKKARDSPTTTPQGMPAVGNNEAYTY